jgi:hypothetical protein
MKLTINILIFFLRCLPMSCTGKNTNSGSDSEAGVVCEKTEELLNLKS